MDITYKEELIRCGIDLDAVLQRLSGDEAVYELCLNMFLRDDSMDNLIRALGENDWDSAFTAAHALKGVAGNMGFVPLFHAAAEMVVLIRSGKTGEAKAASEQLKQRYDEIASVIRVHGNPENRNP